MECYLCALLGDTLRLVRHKHIYIFLYLEEVKEDLFRPCIGDLPSQLLLEHFYYFFLELFNGDVTSSFSWAFDGYYLLLHLGPTLWLVAHKQSDISLYTEDFTEEHNHPTIDNLYIL